MANQPRYFDDGPPEMHAELAKRLIDDLGVEGAIELCHRNHWHRTALFVKAMRSGSVVTP